MSFDDKVYNEVTKAECMKLISFETDILDTCLIKVDVLTHFHN